MAIERNKQAETSEPPKCFVGETQKEATITWWNWNDAALRADPGSSSYCNDCQPWYQAEMIKLGLCEHPGTVFRQERDGSEYKDDGVGLVGIRPTHGKLPIDRKREPFDHPDGKQRVRANAAQPVRPAEIREAEDGIPDAGLRYNFFGSIRVYEAN